MSRILVIGGYGGFGARISRRLAGLDHEVLVAGRDLAKASEHCRMVTGTSPILVDRDDRLDPILAEHRPHLVIDAAGPFQGSDLRIPQACISAGIHYLDIADARDFAAGIPALDQAARTAGVAVVSGASTVPALSQAVVRRLADDCSDVRAIEIEISASNRATGGPAVTRAILSYVGKPIRFWRGGRWSTAHGWQEMRRCDLRVAGAAPLGRRLVALCDVPDLELLPARATGRPAVAFRAGAELDFQNLALWISSWPVRWGWSSGLAGYWPWIGRVQALTARLGSDRSGMRVRLWGIAEARRVERSWTLMAWQGDGPEIPCLAAPILAERILRGRVAAGARDAGKLLTLEDFEPAFSGLRVAHEIVESAQPPSLYARIMGDRFERLPPTVREVHDVLRDGGTAGRASVTRGRNPIARLVARMMRFPAAGDHDLHVHFEERDGIETWTRDFGGKRFRSRLSERGGRLVERFGPLSFEFDLPSDERGLAMTMRGFRLGPIPLPLLLAPRSLAREWEEDGRFHFDVPISLPLIGEVVRYRGWLEPQPRRP